MGMSFKSVTSTQAVIREFLKTGKKLGHLDYVTADEQTEGRGRQGREWISGSGNLLVSIFISEYTYPLTWLPHWVSLSVVGALGKFGVDPKRIRVKWPNDVVIDGTKKISGVLCEKVDQGIIAGIGVNISDSPETLDATSLKKLVSTPLSEDVKQAFLNCMVEALETPLPLSQLKRAYASYSLLQPEAELEWVDPQTQAHGKGHFIRYGDLGELWVRLDDGKEKPLYSEEIHLVKKT